MLYRSNLAHPRSAFGLRPVSPSSAGTNRSVLGGHRDPAIPCPSCSRPLLQLARFDASDDRLDLPRSLGSLPVLFCWRCEAAQGHFTYRLEQDRVQFLRFLRGPVAEDFPYPNYPDSFPLVQVELEPLDEVAQARIHSLNRRDSGTSRPRRQRADSARPRHQIGGEPLLLQPIEPPRCPGCNEPMPFFAALADDCGPTARFTGNDFVQVLVFLCRGCGVVDVSQQTE